MTGETHLFNYVLPIEAQKVVFRPLVRVFKPTSSPIRYFLFPENIIDQNDFQNQLQNDLGPKEVKEAKVAEINEESAEKSSPEEEATV